MEQRQIMSTASPASLWRSYLIFQSSAAVDYAFAKREGALTSAAGRKSAFEAITVGMGANIHGTILLLAVWSSKEAFKKLFKEIEMATSQEKATHAAQSDGIRVEVSQPLKNFRHEIFAQKIAAGCSATASYAAAYGRERDNVAAVKGSRLVRKVHIRERAMAIEAENALTSLPTLAKVIAAFEERTIDQINNAQIQGVFGAPPSWRR